MGLTAADRELLVDVDHGRVVRIWPRDIDVRVLPYLGVKGRMARLRRAGLVYLPPRPRSAISTPWCLSEAGLQALGRHPGQLPLEEPANVDNRG